jgi:hypothetical protein
VQTLNSCHAAGEFFLASNDSEYRDSNIPSFGKISRRSRRFRACQQFSGDLADLNRSGVLLPQWHARKEREENENATGHDNKSYLEKEHSDHKVRTDFLYLINNGTGKGRFVESVKDIPLHSIVIFSFKISGGNVIRCS